MLGSHAYSAVPFGLAGDPGLEIGNFNYRHLILRALKQNLEAVRKANGFKADIKRVIYGKPDLPMKNGEVLIYSIRDVAVLNYQGDSVDRNSYLIRSSSRIRNIYVGLRLLVKNELPGEISDSIIEFREDYADSLIKGLYGRYAPARQLYTLLMDGIANDSGLVAFDISQNKEYTFAGDLVLETEVLFQYKEKFY
ncbi:MAG TPA: hypothetical protein VHO03_07055 [Ignavibacteriales bacterium]|nr:hypothetical protein [Ignavibacteriales bacterium]